MILDYARWPIRVQAPHDRRAHLLQASGEISCGARFGPDLVEATRDRPICRKCRRLPQFLPWRSNEHG